MSIYLAADTSVPRGPQWPGGEAEEGPGARPL